MTNAPRISLAVMLVLVISGAAGAQTAKVPFQQETPLYQLNESTKGISVLLGGSRYGPYGGLYDMPTFSRNYRSWLLPARGADGTLLVVFNGREMPFEKRIQSQGDWILSNDGMHFVGKAELLDEQKAERAFLLTDGGNLGPFAGLELRAIGDSWAAWAKGADESAGWTLILAGETFGPYDEIHDLAFDPSTGSVVAQVERNGETWLVIQGRESGPWEKADMLRDAADDLAALLLANPGECEFRIEGKRYGPYESIGGVWIAPDRRSFAFDAYREGQALLVRDGRESLVDWAEIFPSGEKASYVTVIGGRGFIVDGSKEYGPYAEIRERFFPKEGVWAVQVVNRRGNADLSMIVTPRGEFPGDELRFDGTTYSWVRIDESGKAFLMRLSAER